MSEKDDKYRLTWSGRKDSDVLRAVVEHLRTFPLFKDSEAKLITHEEYTALVEAGEISKPESYWQIKEGEIGLISLHYYSSYTKTWDAISLAKGDFVDGWGACQKHYNLKKTKG